MTGDFFLEIDLIKATQVVCNGLILSVCKTTDIKPAIEGVSLDEAEIIPPELDSQ